MSDADRSKFNENFKRFEPSQSRCYRRPDSPIEEDKCFMADSEKTSEVFVIMSDSESKSTRDAAQGSHSSLETNSRQPAKDIDGSGGRREDRREQKSEATDNSRRDKKDSYQSKDSDRRGACATAESKREDGKKNSNSDSKKDEGKESEKSDVKKDDVRDSSKSNPRGGGRRMSADKASDRRRRSDSGSRRRSSSRGRRRSASGSRRRSSSRGRRRSTSGSRRRSLSRGRRRSGSRGREHTDSRRPRILDHRTRDSLQEKVRQQNNDSRRRSSSRDRATVRARRSSSKPRIIDLRRRSSSRERRKSRSPRRSTSRRRSGSRSRLKRDRSPRGRDRGATASETSQLRESGKPKIIDMRRPVKDDVNYRKRSLSRDRRRSPSPKPFSTRSKPRSRSRHDRSPRSPDNYSRAARASDIREGDRSVDGNDRHRSHPKEEEDLRLRIEMIKRDIDRQKRQLEFQRMAGTENADEYYRRLEESEAVWQQLALEEENRSSGRLQHLSDQRTRSSLASLADHEQQRSPPNWRRRRSSRSQSRSRSPRRLYSPFQDCHTPASPEAPQALSLRRLSRSKSPLAPDRRTYYGIDDASYVNRPPSFSRELPAAAQQFRVVQPSPPHRNISPSSRRSADARQVQRDDVRAAAVDGLPCGPSQMPSDDNRKLMSLYSPVPPGLLREERRSVSRTPSCDRRSSRCGSLDLEWPSSPCQPTSGAGREGSLSPLSRRIAAQKPSERQKLRLSSMQRARDLYADRNNVLGPSFIDVSNTIGADESISAERQSLRALSGSLKMNRAAGFDWAQRSFGDFNVRELMVKGELFDVYKAVDKKGQSVVVLRSVCADDASDGFRRPTLRVIKLLSQLIHPNIVRLLEVIRDSDESAICNGSIGRYYLSYEFCAYDLAGLLHTHNVKLSPGHMACVFRQLLLALAFCHQRNIVHCDVRPCNILVSARGEVKLSYFVGAHHAGDPVGDLSAGPVVGVYYRAPELILGAERWSAAMDMWSAGCVLGEMVRCRPLFMASDELQQLLTISALCGTPSMAVWPDVVKLPRFYMLNNRPPSDRCLMTEFANVPTEIVALLDALLVLNPGVRIQADVALTSHWINDAVDLTPFANELAALEKSKQVYEENMGFRPVDSFDFLCSIGSGDYGYMYKALDSVSNSLVILRTAGDENGLSQDAQKIMSFLRPLVHQNILQLLETVRDSSKSASFSYYLSFEYTAHDLEGLLKDDDIGMSLAHIACLFCQLLKALTFCHVKNIVHCDVRPCNLFISAKGEVKLFGFSNAHMSGDAADLRSLPSESLWYRAPELLLGADKFTAAVDMWSSGCVLGEMLQRKPLFTACTDELQQMLAVSTLCGTPSTVMWPDVVKLPRFYMTKNRPQCTRRLLSEFNGVPSGMLELLDGLLTLNPIKRLMAFTALSGSLLKNFNEESVRATLPVYVYHFISLPKSRDCRSVSKKSLSATAGDNALSRTETTSTGTSDQMLETKEFSADGSVADVKKVTGSLKVDLSSMESIHKALGTLLKKTDPDIAMSTPFGGGGPPGSSAVDGSTMASLHPAASTAPQKKTFMKVIDHQNRPIGAGDEEPDLVKFRQQQAVDWRSSMEKLESRKLLTYNDAPPAAGEIPRHVPQYVRSAPYTDTSGNMQQDQSRSSESPSTKGSQLWDEISALYASHQARQSTGDSVNDSPIADMGRDAASLPGGNSHRVTHASVPMETGAVDRAPSDSRSPATSLQRPQTAEQVSVFLSRFREEPSRVRPVANDSWMSMEPSGRPTHPADVHGPAAAQFSGRDVSRDPGAGAEAGFGDRSKLSISEVRHSAGSPTTLQFRRFATDDDDRPIAHQMSNQPQPPAMHHRPIARALSPIVAETGEDVRHVNLTRQNMLVTFDNDRFRFGDRDERGGGGGRGYDFAFADGDGRRLPTTARNELGPSMSAVEGRLGPVARERGSGETGMFGVRDWDRGAMYGSNQYASSLPRPPTFDAGGDVDQRSVVTRDVGWSATATVDPTGVEKDRVEWRTLQPRF